MFSNLLNPALLPVLCCMLVIGANHPVAENTTKSISIIPQPQSLKRDDGSFVIGKTTKIILAQDDRELSSVGEQLAARLRTVTGYPLEIKIIPD